MGGGYARVEPRAPHSDHGELKAALDGLGEEGLEEISQALRGEYSGRGPKPFDRKAILRALFALHVIPRLTGEKITTLTALRNALINNPAFRIACGFGEFGRIPSRSTFSGVHSQLTKAPYKGMAEEIARRLLAILREDYPNLGEEVAVGSTVIESCANPNRTPDSDPEAAWTKKNDARNRDGVWKYGYKSSTALWTRTPARRWRPSRPPRA